MAEALVGERMNQRILADEKRRSAAKSGIVSDKAKEQVVDQAKKVAVKAGKQAVLRVINVAFAATLVGIIVTYLIMTVQLIAGNLFGIKAIELEVWEVVIWVFLSIIILFAIVLLALVLVIVANPYETAWEAFKSWWN
jgi:hypothetical protein